MASTGGARPAPDPLFKLRGHQTEIQSLSYHHNNDNILLSGDASGCFKVWDVKKRRETFSRPNSHTEPILAVFSSSTKEQHVYTSGRDGRAYLWDISQSFPTLPPSTATAETGDVPTPVRTLLTRGYTFCAGIPVRNPSQSSLQGSVAMPCDVQEDVQIWDDRTPQPVMTLKPDMKDTGMAMSMCHVPVSGHDYLLVGYESGHIAVQDLSTGEAVHTAKMHQEPVFALTCHPQTMQGLSGSADKTVKSFTLDTTGSLSLTEISSWQHNHGGIQGVAIRQDGRIGVSAGWDHRVRVFDMKKQRPLAILKGHRESVMAIAVPPTMNGPLASAGKDARIALWEMYPRS